MFGIGKQATEATEVAASVAVPVAGIVQRHAGLLYRVAHSVLRHPQEAEDVVQDTFVYFLGDATNDAAFDKRDTQHLALWHAAYLGALYWLAIPPRGKSMARNCTSQGFFADDSVEIGMGMASVHTGDTLTCSVETTHGEPMVLAYQVRVGDAGKFALTIDRGTPAVYGGDAAGLQPITFHGAASTVLAVRLPVATGPHTIAVKNISPGSNGTVSMQWLAMPPRTDWTDSLPFVVTLSAIHPVPTEAVGTLTGKEFDTLTGQYDDWIQAATAQAQQDGLNVHYADTRSALGTDPANFADAVHPNQAGYTLMARAILKLFGK